jgi:glutamate N-acetyltransferase/amino-acid N-acetyltransferase
MAKFTPPVSPLAPKHVVAAPPVAGVRFATAEAGIRYAGRTDVLLVALDPGTAAAGVFTRSKCPSAPVEWCRAVLPAANIRGLVVNSGNANAFTGMKGRQSIARTAAIAAAALGCAPDEVLLASTGVIGEPLDASKFDGVLASTAGRLAPTPWLDAARAIMTTDTYPKVATRSATVDGVPVTLTGIAKGAGMIAPDMATMLSFVFTDAAISPDALRAMLARGAEASFNAITVDSDTSTSDTLIAFATGKADAATITDAADPRAVDLVAALDALLLDLAHQVVRDGEGARKFVEVSVTGAVSDSSAKRVALSIANSPLVKTAIAGEDANWGRVVMAVGKAGEPAERDRLSVFFGGIRVAAEGEREPGYDEAAVSAAMRDEHIRVGADLGLGTGRATVWTCDLTKDYVAINGDYRS